MASPEIEKIRMAYDRDSKIRKKRCPSVSARSRPRLKQMKDKILESEEADPQDHADEPQEPAPINESQRMAREYDRAWANIRKAADYPDVQWEPRGKHARRTNGPEGSNGTADPVFEQSGAGDEGPA